MIKTKNALETLARDIYKITGKTLTDNEQFTTVIAGTTYNFWESPMPFIADVSYGKDADNITLAEAFDVIAQKLYKNSPLPDGAIDVIFEIMDITTSDFIDFDRVQNREFLLRFYAQQDQIPDNYLYPVLFYLLTGKTLYVKRFREFKTHDDFNIHAIGRFINRHQKALAYHFRQNRALLLFIKKLSSPEIKAIINKISKNSRKVNRPSAKPKSLRKDFWSKADLEKKSTDELTRMLHASNTIVVRNGRRFVNEKMDTNPYPRDLIVDILHTRSDVFTDEQKAYQKKGWSIAVPASAKQGAGELPNGSHFTVMPGDKIGIRWFTDADYDLSATVLSQYDWNEKYGWNGRKHGLLNYSGDMTHTMINPQTEREEASEWIEIPEDALNQSIIFDFSVYQQSSKHGMLELFVGDEVVPIKEPTNTTIFGYMKNGEFYIYIEDYGRARVNVTSANDFSQNMLDKTFYYL